MKVVKLEVSGLRAFSQAEFTFNKGMNLLVGVNGVGKTTALEALRICLSKIMPEITSTKSRKDDFRNSDIKIGTEALQVSCDFEVGSVEFNLLIQKKKEPVVGKELGNPREQVIETPDIEKCTPSLQEKLPNSKKSNVQPLAIYFSTKRSLAVDQKPTSAALAGGQAAAFADSLSGNREFNLRLIAQWYKVQEQLAAERPIALKHISAIRKAVHKFLPRLNNLHIIDLDGVPHFMVEKNGVPLSAFQLSDGERGMLSLVMDLAKRLSQANPELDNPLRDGVAVVLIDELDLHLHPRWQRTIVENLTRTFPGCQFIATTHSPQIIPTLEPESVQLISTKGVLRPDRTFGMDSNWILRHLMETDERPEEAIKHIETIEDLIGEGDFANARSKMLEFKNEGYDFPEWSVFEARIARLELISKGK